SVSLGGRQPACAVSDRCVMLGTCFGCEQRKVAFATLRLSPQEETVFLCQDCLSTSAPALARLAVRLRIWLRATHGAHVHFDLWCQGSGRSLSLIMASLGEIARAE